MTAPETDPLRAFTNALPWRLRDALRLDHTTIPVIREAAERVGPTELAHTAAKGITRAYANPWPLLWHRIQREAGVDTDNTEEVTP